MTIKGWRWTWGVLAMFLLAPGLAAAADRLTIGVLAASAADLATTQWGMAPGVHDVNPIINGPTSATLVKVGATAGVLLLDRELKRRGHKRASKVLKITTIVVWGSAAAWNTRQALQHRGSSR